MWSFETDHDFETQLAWVREFMRNDVEPLDYFLGNEWNVHDPNFIKYVRPLQNVVREKGLWACHLGPELGGQGYGQVKLALLNEQLGRSRFGPVVFGTQAPDTGNSEILAHYGTAEQKERYLRPLLDNDIVSCFAMTEPQGGADPLVIETSAVLEGDEWVINGEKWFASNARYAAFYIVMAVTDPAADPHRRMSMFIVPADAPGIEIVKNYGFYGEIEDCHAHMRWTNVRVPKDHLLGGQGEAFVVAQVRLGGGRLHHAMRALARANRVFDMLCERAASRFTKGEQLAKKQMVQEKIADSWVELHQFRLLVLETAWLADKYKDWHRLRKNVAAVKAAMPKLLNDVASRALHIHGSLGISHDMPFAEMVIYSFMLGLADGPTEVHKVTVAREVMRDVKPSESMFPSYLASEMKARAMARYPLSSAKVMTSYE